VLRSDELAISVSSPCSISVISDLHVELALSIVVVRVCAAPGCAAIIARALNSVECGLSTAVSIGLNPVNFDTPVIAILGAVAVVALIEVLANVGGTDCVDVGVDTCLCA